jgi:hypothetical protein
MLKKELEASHTSCIFEKISYMLNEWLLVMKPLDALTKVN